MTDFVFQSDHFPSEPEGDLDLCNGQPGSALIQWLSNQLAQAGYAMGEPIQEDYGWGCWLQAPETVWLAVSFAGRENGLTEWHVSVVHAPWPFTRQWWRPAKGRQTAQAMAQILLRAVCAEIDPAARAD